MKKISINILVSLFAMLLFIAGCSSVQEVNAPIKVGVFLPLTGEVASWGENALAGITLATDEINAKGGVNGRKLKLVIEDDKCSNTEGVNAVQKLVGIDKVDVLVGGICSSAMAPELPPIEASGIPHIIITSSAPDLTKPENVFRVYPSDALQGKKVADFILSEYPGKKVAVIHVQNAWGEGIQKTFKEAFRQKSGQIVYEGGVTQTETDFKTEMQKVEQSGAEVLYMPVYPVNAVSAGKQMKEMGFEIPVIGGDTFDGEEVTSNEYMEGILYTTPHINSPDSFKQRIRQQSGFENLEISMVASLGYDAAKVMYDAVEKAGTTDKASVIHVLKQTNYRGISNDVITFDSQGDITTTAFEVRLIKDGKSVEYKLGGR